MSRARGASPSPRRASPSDTTRETGLSTRHFIAGVSSSTSLISMPHSIEAQSSVMTLHFPRKKKEKLEGEKRNRREINAPITVQVANLCDLLLSLSSVALDRIASSSRRFIPACYAFFPYEERFGLRSDRSLFLARRFANSVLRTKETAPKTVSPVFSRHTVHFQVIGTRCFGYSRRARREKKKEKETRRARRGYPLPIGGIVNNAFLLSQVIGSAREEYINKKVRGTCEI